MEHAPTDRPPAPLRRVVISREELESVKRCTLFSRAHTSSPEWDETEQALVYEDFDATVERLIRTSEGRDQIRWLVRHELVPMSSDELSSRIAAARAAKIAGGTENG